MHDYQITCKLDNGDDVISQLTEEYWLLLTLNDKAYVGGLYCSLLGWAYQKSVNGFAYQMANENASVINEESGEMLFSILARKQLASSAVSKLDQVNTTYRDLRTYIDASKAMKIGTQLSEFHTGGRQNIKQKSESVGATAHHFKSVIRALRMNNHHAYSGDPQGYRNKIAGSSHQIPLIDHEWFLGRQVNQRTHEIRTKVRLKLGTPWVYSFASIWPTASQRPAGPDGLMVGPGSDHDSSVSDDNGSDESDEGDDDMSSPGDGSPPDDMVQDLMQDFQHDEKDNKHNEETEDIKQSREDEKRNERSDSDIQSNHDDDDDHAVTSDPERDEFDEHSHNLSKREREGIDERERRIRMYEAKPQKERKEEYSRHTAISDTNLVQGKRVRKSTAIPVVKNCRRKGPGKS